MSDGQGGGSRVEWAHALTRAHTSKRVRPVTGGETLVRTGFDGLSLLQGRSVVVPACHQTVLC